MSFWKSDLGEITGSYENAFTKDIFESIPDGTMALAKIEAFTNEEQENFKYLSVEWSLIEGDFKDRKIRQKLKVFGGSLFDKDPEKTRFKALNMLKLLYKLFNLTPKHTNEPTDQDLLSFVGKIAGIKIKETRPNDEGRKYNWISEVHKADGFKCETGVSIVTMSSHVRSENGIDSAFRRNNIKDGELLEDDVPF